MDIINRLFLYIKPYKKRFIYAIVCMVFVALFQSVLMLLIKPAVDEIFANKKVDLIKWILLGIFTAASLKFIFSYWQSYLLSWIGNKVVQNLRDELYEKLIHLSLGYFIKSQTGMLMSRLTYDISQIQRAIVMIPRNILRDGLNIIFYLGILFYLNWKWTIATLVAFPLISLILIKFGKKIRSRSQNVQSQTGSIYSFLQEKISGIKLIKSFSTEQYETALMKKQNEDYFKNTMRLTRADIIQAPLIEYLAIIGIGIVIAWGGIEVINGKATQGTFIAFIATILSLYRPAKDITTVNTDIQTAISAGKRIFDILDEKPVITEKEGAEKIENFEKEIKFEGVHFRYESEKPIISGLDLSIKKGETVALVGPSGCGKTTIISLLPRLFDVNAGKITIDGKDIRNYTIKSIRTLMSMVTQETILFNESVKNNIAYGTNGVSQEEIENSAKMANAHGFIMKLPQKYDTIIGEKGVTLSGGERQRLAIARTILRNPKILILDEATSALDSENEALVQEALLKIMQGRTTIIIAHRLSTIKSADKIIVVDKGTAVAVGTHEELMEKCTIYKRLYEIQFLE